MATPSSNTRQQSNKLISLARPLKQTSIFTLVITLSLALATLFLYHPRSAIFTLHANSIPLADMGVAFGPTIPNTQSPPGKAPQGMVWIPGGEFSMGAQDPPGMDMVGMKATQDSRPIHRVYVDGFFMDKTDVTNAAIRRIRESHWIYHHCRKDSHRRGFPRCSAREPCRRRRRILSAGSPCSAQQSLPMVELCQRRKLAPSHRPKEFDHRQAQLSRRSNCIR